MVIDYNNVDRWRVQQNSLSVLCCFWVRVFSFGLGLSVAMPTGGGQAISNLLVGALAETAYAPKRPNWATCTSRH
jgi:hypothetical protein